MANDPHSQIPASDSAAAQPAGQDAEADSEVSPKVGSQEFGGRKGPEPTRYGDWEKQGRCIDF